MNNDLPKVSVILPIYNVDKYLRKCLESVTNQTYRHLEIICVNDCSTDNSIKIINEYLLKDNRIILVDREFNGGLSAARNSGLEIARGDYVYFIDSDDYVDLDYIEKMVSAAIENNASVVLNTNIVAHNNDTTYAHLADKTYNNIYDQFIDAKTAIFNIIWNTWAHLWKKSFLDEHNLKFPDGYIIEDLYFQAISYVYLEKIFVTRASTYHYTIRNNSIMGNLKKEVFYADLRIMNKIFDYYAENHLLDKIHNVKMFSELLIPQNGNDKFNQFLKLKDYFLRIKKYINNREIYTKGELALFDNTLSDINKAMKINYMNIYLLDKLKQNITRKNLNNVKK